MARCWEQRGCDEGMQARCPHAFDVKEKCPADCVYGDCVSASRVVTSDPNLVFDATVDRSVARKDSCSFCGFFLTSGPRLQPPGS